MYLYVIRHGESYVNLPEWDADRPGGWDAGLTERGFAQAQALAQWLPTHVYELDALYSSSMQRAYQTAEVLAAAYNIDIRADDRLREYGNNYADHRPIPAEQMIVNTVELSLERFPYNPPYEGLKNAETMFHFRARVALFMEEIIIKHLGQHVVTVAHGGVVNSVFAYCFNIPPISMCVVHPGHTTITHFEYRPRLMREKWILHYQGRCEHLRR